MAARAVNPRDWKVLVTIHWIHPERSYCKALNPDGVEYFIFYNAFQATDYRDIGDVEIGTQVKGTPINHPRGPRLIEVEIVEI